MGTEGVVIVRVFRARVHSGKKDECERFVLGTGLPMVKAAEGCTRVTAGKAAGVSSPSSPSSRTGAQLTLCRRSRDQTGSKR
jgi:hypothetical protein